MPIFIEAALKKVLWIKGRAPQFSAWQEQCIRAIVSLLFLMWVLPAPIELIL